MIENNLAPTPIKLNFVTQEVRATFQKPDNKAIGSQVREARQSLHLSIAELAQKCGLSTSLLTMLEAGHRTWSKERLESVEKTLNGLQETA